jgi:hypothetical protein
VRNKLAPSVGQYDLGLGRVKRVQFEHIARHIYKDVCELSGSYDYVLGVEFGD